jgi:hypothetical protein
MATTNAPAPVTLPAAADLSSYQYRFMVLNTSQQVTYVSSAGGNAQFVLLNKPSAAGDAAELRCIGSGGIQKMVAGAATTAGALIQSDAVGRAIDAGSSDYALGFGIDAAGAAGDVIRVVLGANYVTA